MRVTGKAAKTVRHCRDPGKGRPGIRRPGNAIARHRSSDSLPSVLMSPAGPQDHKYRGLLCGNRRCAQLIDPNSYEPSAAA